MLERGVSSSCLYTPLSIKEILKRKIMPPKLNNSFSADVSGLGMPGSLIDYGSYGPSGDWPTIKTHGTGFMGSWSKEDQALFEVQMAAAQQQNAWSQMEYENWYNSPDQQARRQRLAGLNPDLIGVENTPSASPGNVTPPSGPAGNGVGEFASLFGSIFSAFSTAMNIANGVQTFRSGVESVRSQRLDNLGKIDTLALNYLLDTELPISDDRGVVFDGGPSLEDTLIGANMYAKDNGFSRSDRKSFVESVRKQYNSPSFQESYYRKSSNTAKSRVELAETRAQPFYFDSDETLRIALLDSINMKFEAMKSGWQQQKSYNDFQSDYYSSMNGALQGQSQNDIVGLEAQKARMERMMLSARYKMLRNLYKNFQAGNQFSGIMLGLMDFGVNAGPTIANMIK